MIKAILIDIDDTLLDFQKSSMKAIEICFKNCDLPFDNNVLTVFHQINDGLWHKIEKKEITKPQLYEQRWKNIFEALNINFDGIEMEQLFRSTLSGIAEPVDNAYTLLEYLYKKYPLYAASNSSFEHQKKRMTQANMLKYFKKMYVSEFVGAPKPAKEFFDYCLNDIGNVSPHEIVIIGDSLSSDILGGVNYGLKTIWFNPSKKAINSPPFPDHTVSTLLEIQNIL